MGAKDGCASRTSVGGSPNPAADGGFLKGQNVGEPGLEFGYCDSWLYWYVSPTHLRCLWLLMSVCLGCLETVGLDLRPSPLPLGQGPTVAFTNKPVQGGAYQLRKASYSSVSAVLQQYCLCLSPHSSAPLGSSFPTRLSSVIEEGLRTAWPLAAPDACCVCAVPAVL